MQCQGPRCTIEVEQAPGGHRQRVYCSDRCRVAASRVRAELAEQARIKAEREAQEQREREALRAKYPTLAEESRELLYSLQKRWGYGGQPLVDEIGAALVCENERAGERQILAAHLFRRGQKKSFPCLRDPQSGQTLIWGNLGEWFEFCNKANVPTLRRALEVFEGNPNVTTSARSSIDTVTIEPDEVEK